MRDIIQSFCGFAIFVAVFYSWLFTLPFLNRVILQSNRDGYRPDTFVVTGAEFVYGSEGGDASWLNGIVAECNERFVPPRTSAYPESEEALLMRYPRGSKIAVLYNPNLTSALVQDESLRVLLDRPDIWQRENASWRRLARRVFLPVPCTIAIYLAVRHWNRRHIKDHASATRS